MQLINYLEYLEKTVMAYSDKVKRHLVKQFIQHGIATKQTDTSGQLYIEGRYFRKNIVRTACNLHSPEQKSWICFRKMGIFKRL